MLHTLFCFCLWTLVFFASIWRISHLSQKAKAHFQKIHQIPCSNCVFFTGEYHLKCPLHPLISLSEQAIDCQDFEPQL
ncbi:MAG: hypothetical protein AAGF83_17835 [Cyanobacteria bacterium P01_G01_bin.67]